MSALFLERVDVPRARTRVPSLADVIRLPVRGDASADLVALREGDPAAIARCYRAHHGAVEAFARRMLGDPEAARDVVHDVFVSLPDAARRFREGASLRTFLIGIALNLCRRRIRTAVRKRRALTRIEEGATHESPSTPEAETSRLRLADALRRGLETLPLAQREAFVLCAVEERPSPEVAEILGVPEGTVRTRLFHARKKLRAFLEAEGVS